MRPDTRRMTEDALTQLNDELSGLIAEYNNLIKVGTRDGKVKPISPEDRGILGLKNHIAGLEQAQGLVAQHLRKA